MSQPWELEIRLVPVADLREMNKNARTHGPRSIEAIKQSLETHGQRKPVVVASDGVTVIAGNGTLVSARQLGWEMLAVADSPYAVDSDEAKAYALADNRVAELSAFDRDIVAETLSGLDKKLRSGIGWNPDEIATLTGGPKPVQSVHFGNLTEPGSPPPPPPPKTQEGEGSSTAAEGNSGGVPSDTKPEYETISLTVDAGTSGDVRGRLVVLKEQWGCETLGDTVVRLLDEYDVLCGGPGSGA